MILGVITIEGGVGEDARLIDPSQVPLSSPVVADAVAEGLIAASKTLSMNIPLIVRLEGTNVVPGVVVNVFL